MMLSFCEIPRRADDEQTTEHPVRPTPRDCRSISRGARAARTTCQWNVGQRNAVSDLQDHAVIGPRLDDAAKAWLFAPEAQEPCDTGESTATASLPASQFIAKLTRGAGSHKPFAAVLFFPESPLFSPSHMSSNTAAQDEFNQLVSNNTARATTHPEDKHDTDLSDRDLSEEETYRNTQIDAAMRTTTVASELKLPPASFDSGRFTGVKGVIADARSYETARKTKWVDRARNARRSILGFAGMTSTTGNSVTITGGARSDSDTDDDAKSHNDEDSFLSEWRESRRRELESAANRAVRTRKTSPSVRIYGRLDEVDAMGYLDAIEKVNRETTVVVFVCDHECEVSATIEDALVPLVHANPTTHFVKVHYDEIEFDPAAVPSLLAYRNQGDLVANLTGIIEMMPDDDSFDSASLKRILQQHRAL
ncbi:phosducin [Cordyceps militaris CM01]|uniref:Phosducin n=1 Tax=Cordyceps militaris (strain CM01) TaxID=983644 RepID=G3JUN7_CORMM|nr:phosducin [Cordyceps militaris CM01]EGX87837.1 phosducin [Cordyceps militaris CM01]